MSLTKVLESAKKIALEILHQTESRFIENTIGYIIRIEKSKAISKKLNYAKEAIARIEEYIKQRGRAKPLLELRKLLKKIYIALLDELKERNRFVAYIDRAWTIASELAEQGNDNATEVAYCLKRIMEMIKADGGVFQKNFKNIANALNTAIFVQRRMIKNELLERELLLARNELKRIKEVLV